MLSIEKKLLDFVQKHIAVLGIACLLLISAVIRLHSLSKASTRESISSAISVLVFWKKELNLAWLELNQPEYFAGSDRLNISIRCISSCKVVTTWPVRSSPASLGIINSTSAS